MVFNHILSSLHVSLNDLPMINGECFVPYVRVFCSNRFEIHVSWNLKQTHFTIALIDNRWVIRVEDTSHEQFYDALRIIQKWITSEDAQKAIS